MVRRVAYDRRESIEQAVLEDRSDPAALAAILNNPTHRKVSVEVVEFIEKLRRAEAWEPPPMEPGHFCRPPEIGWLSRAVRFPIYLEADWFFRKTPRGLLGNVVWKRVYSWRNLKNLCLHIVVNLDNQGRLACLRRCDECNQWFAARRKDQKFHSSKCKQKKFRSTDEYKREAAEKMRKYRASAGATGR